MRHLLIALAAAGILGGALVGCTKEEPKADEPAKTDLKANTEKSGMTAEQAHSSLPMGEDGPKEDVAELQKKQEDAKAAFDKAPKDDKAKKEYVDATVKLATATMMGPLPPNQKYRAALKLYREALKIDPTNAEATEYKNTIEGIYKDMGRPVPE